jgi:hypothetical protein
MANILLRCQTMHEHDRACDVWLHLSKVDQLTVNREEYKRVNQLVCECLDIVESIRKKIEVSTWQSTNQPS